MIGQGSWARPGAVTQQPTLGGHEGSGYELILTRQFPWATSSAIAEAARLMRAWDDDEARYNQDALDRDEYVSDAQAIADLVDLPSHV